MDMDIARAREDLEKNTNLASSPAPEMIVVFEVGSLLLGIDVLRVREVARAVPISAPLPDAGALVGMITLRGEAVAVIDLAEVLGISCKANDRRRIIAVEHNDTTVCLLVDRIDGLFNVSDADLQSPPSIVAEVDVRWLDYVTRSAKGELIGVININRVLSQDSLSRREGEATCV